MQRTESHAQAGLTGVVVNHPCDELLVSAAAVTTSAIVRLSPVQEGDEVAEDRIRRTEITSTGGQFRISLPEPPPVRWTSVGGVQVQQSATVVTGSMVGFQAGRIGGGNSVTTTGSSVAAGVDGRVHVHVAVPDGSGLDATSQSGGVDTYGTLTQIRLRSQSGGLDAEHVADRLVVDTQSGTVTAHRLQGSAVIQTMSGRVQLPNVQGRAAVESMSGQVLADVYSSGSLQAKTMSGAITASAPQAEQVRTSTMSGQLMVNGQRRRGRC